MVKHYRFRKIKPDMVEEMKKLKESGLSYKAIAKKFNVGGSIISYWLSPLQRENAIKRSKKSYAKLTLEQKKDRIKKNYGYIKEYNTERYNKDEEFRKRYIKCVFDSFKRRREAWKEQNKCLVCGKDKINKKYKQCEKCREKERGRKVKRKW